METKMIEVHELDENFYVKQSNLENAGQGLFAKNDLPLGYQLEVVGVVVRKNSAAEACTRYARDYRFGLTETEWIIPTGWAGVANHSDETNSKLVSSNGKLYLEMTKNIKANEEIVYQYADAAQIRINVNSKGQGFAVVFSNLSENKVIVKMVTPNLMKAMQIAQSNQREGWAVMALPTHIDMSEFKGNF